MTSSTMWRALGKQPCGDGRTALRAAWACGVLRCVRRESGGETLDAQSKFLRRLFAPPLRRRSFVSLRDTLVT
jgi:hypothetical protein